MTFWVISRGFIILLVRNMIKHIEPLHGPGLTAVRYRMISHDACPMLGITGLLAGVESPDMASECPALTGKSDTSWPQHLSLLTHKNVSKGLLREPFCHSAQKAPWELLQII